MLRTLACSIVMALNLGLPPIVAQESTAPPAASIDHVAIYTSDLGKSVAFYKEVFGFRQLATPFNAPLAVAWLDMWHGIALHVVAGRKQRTENAWWDHLAIACSGIDSMIARLNEHGIPWTDMPGKHQPQRRPDGVRQIFVQDPDGFWIEINDRLQPKP